MNTSSKELNFSESPLQRVKQRKDEVIMKFTFEEWKFIQHCIECAGRDFEKMMLDSKVSDAEFSSYQIFKRQMEEANTLVEKIKSSEI